MGLTAAERTEKELGRRATWPRGNGVGVNVGRVSTSLSLSSSLSPLLSSLLFLPALSLPHFRLQGLRRLHFNRYVS